MNIKFEANVLTVVSDIDKATVEAGYTSLNAKDEKGNIVYAVDVNKEGDAALTPFSFTGNTYVDDKLAATIIFPIGTTQDQVQKRYGDALLAAKKYVKEIGEAAATKKADIEALFA